MLSCAGIAAGAGAGGAAGTSAGTSAILNLRTTQRKTDANKKASWSPHVRNFELPPLTAVHTAVWNHETDVCVTVTEISPWNWHSGIDSAETKFHRSSEFRARKHENKRVSQCLAGIGTVSLAHERGAQGSFPHIHVPTSLARPHHSLPSPPPSSSAPSFGCGCDERKRPRPRAMGQWARRSPSCAHPQ